MNEKNEDVAHTAMVSEPDKTPEFMLICNSPPTGCVKMLGISPDLLRWRIKIGKYPDAPRGNGDRRLFTTEHIQKLRGLR